MEQQKLSYSQITTHRTCPQKYKYGYVDFLEKRDPEAPRVELDLGTWWHAIRAVDAIRRGAYSGSLKSIPERIEGVGNHALELHTLEQLLEKPSRTDNYEKTVFLFIREWWKSLTLEAKDAFISKIGCEPLEQLERMNKTWNNRWETALKHEQVLAIEVRFDRELPPMRLSSDSEPMSADTTLFGYVDEVYLDTRRDMVVIRDHKTAKALEASTSLSDMQESQLQLYAWAVSPLLKEWGIEKSPGAVAYDRIRSSAPKKPTLTKSGKLSASVKDYDLETYLEFAQGENGQGVPYEGLKKDGSGAGIYTAEADLIEKLSTREERDKWATRTFTPLNMNLIKAHLKSAFFTAQDISRTKELVEVVNEAPRNMTKMNCKFCDMAELCRSQMFGGAQGDYDLEAMGILPKEKSTR